MLLTCLPPWHTEKKASTTRSEHEQKTHDLQGNLAFNGSLLTAQLIRNSRAHRMDQSISNSRTLFVDSRRIQRVLVVQGFGMICLT